jgi:hypothetical protein
MAAVVFAGHEPFLRTDAKQNIELKQIFCQLDGWSVVCAEHKPFLQTDAKQTTELKQTFFQLDGWYVAFRACTIFANICQTKYRTKTNSLPTG